MPREGGRRGGNAPACTHAHTYTRRHTDRYGAVTLDPLVRQSGRYDVQSDTQKS